MKVLNLDKLSKREGREIVLFGETHAVDGMTVSNFIETTRQAEALANETSLVKQVEATIEMIIRSVPTLKREQLTQLELGQLQAIVAFVRGDAVDGVESKEDNAQKK